MMTCKEVSTLIARGEQAEASLMRRLAVQFHLAMCRRCRAFRRQLEAISQAARSMAAQEEPGREFEARLTERMRDGAPRAE
jgi:predicted anti-sigma-YlaC factor YlaD